MNIISHRGNLEGRSIETENHPSQIIKAMGEGFDVEVDVWVENNKWFLGHDEPTYEIDFQFISNYKNKLWVHAKNLNAVSELQHKSVNWFWHQEDYVTLTSKGNIWCFPGYEVDGGIMVDYGQTTEVKVHGICTNFPLKWIEEIE